MRDAVLREISDRNVDATWIDAERNVDEVREDRDARPGPDERDPLLTTMLPRENTSTTAQGRMRKLS